MPTVDLHQIHTIALGNGPRDRAQRQTKRIRTVALVQHPIDCRCRTVDVNQIVAGPQGDITVEEPLPLRFSVLLPAVSVKPGAAPLLQVEVSLPAVMLIVQAPSDGSGHTAINVIPR